MAQIRSVEFLPEIFQTPVNRQVLGATLDQLIQEPSFVKTQGYVGRKVGPGVNPADKYVIEPTKSRNDYQLEPGVISLDPDTNNINDAITYPGITDALKLQGAVTDNANNLYTSEYYTWDPFVDFDKFVNYSEYYWLPGGPLSVDVSATGVPLTDNFVVTRANGVYTFSGVQGTNPPITLVRGGEYTFQVAQNSKETVNFRVTNNATSAYVIDYENNPTLTLVRGNTYVFNLSLDRPLPFFIKTLATLGNTNLYNNGVENNGASSGLITFVVPQDAPNTLYYANSTQFNMRGVINIVDAVPGTGPGFWIQTNPGVSGKIPATPNISSRDVLGVVNNGEDLGTVTFDVPYSTAQNFYYSLDTIGNIPGKVSGTIDLVTNLKFNQINNIFLEPFLEANPNGIDGIKELNGKTIVFLNQTDNAEDGGWQITTQFDPLPNEGQTVSPVGSFDTTEFDQTTDITSQAQRYSVWQINYNTTAGGQVFMTLSSVLPVDELQKFSVQYGTAYANTGWYKNASGYFEQIPLLTAIKSVLYYQDGTDPEIFGTIRLLDPGQASTIFIEDILNQQNYVSPNGVTFTNGLTVVFRGDVEPASYQNQEYYVEGVGTAIKLLPVANFVTPEPYTNSETLPYDSTPYDFGNYDATLNAPQVPDYLTINRASSDLNAWTRSNRWFHIDVIYASAEYNNTTPVVDNLLRARRPILEFRAGTKLFDFGTEGKQPVNIIDFEETDALSNINGTTGYSLDGYSLIQGSRIIFAADIDPQVRNKIYQVEFIIPDTVPPLIAQPIINLVPASDATVLVNQSTVCLSGITLQGKSFYFDGVEWLPAQDKVKVNQAPLFDVYDQQSISFGNREKYPSTSFAGSKLFSYATTSSGVADTVLGFALKYLSLTNVGDIVFDNNLYSDTFTYVAGAVGQTKDVSEGFARQYSDRINFVKEIGWQTAATKSQIRQQFQFVYDGSPLKLDVAVESTNVVRLNGSVPAIQLFVNSQFQEPSNYTYTTTTNATTITLTTTYVPGDVIEVAVLSNQISQQGFYQVPINLENNPLNANSPTFTLGTVRSHYQTIGQNLIDLQGPIIGANNSRDLGNIIPYGLQILQQSSPLTLSGYFMRNQNYDIFGAIEYNSKEYIKFKNLMLDTVIRNEYPLDMAVAEILDSVIAEITDGRTSINPFYWSDMLPTGSVYTETVDVITPISTNTFNTVQTYNFTSANYLGLLVYLTRTVDGVQQTILLERDYQYEVSTEGPTFTVTTPLLVGDVITIREYSNTSGNFVPNTPSKMGLYPKYRPNQFYDTNYVSPTLVIQGHDGSITVAFGDIRDQILLEFEKRIYNNIKVDDNPIPLTTADVIPGFFRTTDYSLTQINNILGESFLTWVGYNKLDYKAQDYNVNNAFTYNYSAAGNKINEQLLLGAWRGIYRYFYDTTSPNLTPWEMLGFSEQPDWWETRYGPSPYTSDNLILWDDLAAGYVADPVAPYFKPKYARPASYGSANEQERDAPWSEPPYPSLLPVIPTGTSGQLLTPLQSVVGQYDPTAFRKSWAVGDGGPVEYSWWSSSSYPFAVMRLLALTRPAEFFALFADRDLYRFDPELNQYLYNGRYRLDANGVQVYGNGVSKASYINWIVDYNRQLGRNSTDDLTKDLANLDVRLCYRMASFTDKQYLKIFVERSSPNSTNSSLLLPDDSYKLLLYKNQPFSKIIYSALIIEKVNDGYAVYGYNNASPYFNILASFSNGLTQTVSDGDTTVKVPAQYTDTVVQVPYGYVFTNTTTVVDFILSYGAYLKELGLIFADQENGYVLNWNQMATEFLYFSQQGWANGTIINLNPSATNLRAYREGEVVDTIVSTTPENMLLDQNRQALPTRDLIVDREGNSFSITSASNQSISFLNLKFTSYENMVVLDNLSVFSDLVYDPTTGARQNRIKIAAATSTDWNGTIDAPGFILNQNNIKQWQSNRKYAKGEIVLYKNNYWSAQTIVQPKVEFDFNDWVKSDYTRIQEGLLPNLANKANQLSNSYNTQVANLERDNDLFSYGLIGFRPRQYMTDLNLDDISQVNLYQQFLKNKGTVRAAEIFTQANLGKEAGEYNIFENWAVLVSTYGANANRSFFELRLNESNLKSDPCTIQVIQPDQPSQANQTIFLDDIWRESYKITSTDILPTTYTTEQDAALPTAGYVNINDVDITAFSLDDPSSIEASIDSIGVGTTIWVAKSNSYDWNVYRCAKVPGQATTITDNLNSTTLVEFNASHDLSVGDLIIIKFFDNSINGVYRVLSVPGVTSIVIAYAFTNSNQTSVSGTGIVFYLQSMRVAQASDTALLPYSNSLIPGARAYVDSFVNGHWAVIEKQSPFVSYDLISPDPLELNSRYGVSVAQTENLFSALIGSPEINGLPGKVYAYRVDENQNYVQEVALTLPAVDVVGYGNTVKFGKNNWAVAGASASRNNTGYAATLFRDSTTGGYTTTQLLLSPDQNFGTTQFGTAVAMSLDERWMYIGAPFTDTGGAVHAYGRVNVEQQQVVYRTDGTTKTFNWSNHIAVNYAQPDQLIVILNNQTLTANVDFTVDVNNVIFNVAPAAKSLLTIVRRQSIQLDKQDYYNVAPNTTSPPGGTGAKFTVNVVRGQYNATITDAGSGYAPGDVLTILGTQLNGSAPANNLVITVTGVNTGIESFTFTGSGPVTTAPWSLNPYLYTATDIYSFTVLVNSVIQRPKIDYEFDSDSTIGTQDLVFLTNPPPGAIIDVIAETYWQYCDTISVTALSADLKFGISLSTTTDGRQLFIGASRDSAVDANNLIIRKAGSVYAFDRSVVRYFVQDVDTVVYAIPTPVTGPVSVMLNSQFLNIREFTDANGFVTIQYINGGVDVDLFNNEITILSSTSLTVGDSIEIETNQFQQIQKITADSPKDESAFGTAVDICPTNCSLYVGAPTDSVLVNGLFIPQSGSAQRSVNQSRVYGVITSLIANPPLTAGDLLRINNVEVAVPSTYVKDGITLPGNNVAGLVAAINSAGIPNVIATPTPNVEFIGNGITKVFNVGTIYTDADSYTPQVYVGSVLQINNVDYSYDNNTQQIFFVSAPVNGSIIVVVSGRMTLGIKNSEAATGGNKLTVLPGTSNSVFNDLGFETFVFTQQITSPQPSAYALFGQSLSVNSNATNIVIGAPNGNVYEPTTFDGGETYFDQRSTVFSNLVQNSGVVYTYDYLPSATDTINDPGQFAFGQQIYYDELDSFDQFGLGLSYRNGRLAVGAPGNDAGDSSVNYGLVSIFNNPTRSPAWAVIHEQQPVVDVNLINGVFMYDRLTSNTQTYFDFIDPLQGKILGAARRNIDYIGAVDPANYNVGSVRNNGNSWGSEHVGEIWWDTDTVRFIDPNQDDIVYASRRWGQTFPGSSVDVYQWISSSVPPVSYTGPGIPLSTSSYSVRSTLNNENIFVTSYYFWARGINTINTKAGKTLSTTGISRYIESPRASGIPYIAALNSSTIAIYNGLEYISAADTILHVDYDRELTDANIHTEYQLIADGVPDSFLNDTLYRKLQDSFCGANSQGAVVPDPFLSPPERYGVQFRPRQSMFVDRFMALQNYLTRVNAVLKQYPIIETSRLNLLNSEEPEPSSGSGAWNKRVANLEELSYQNLEVVDFGYRYLVDSDSSQNGLWTIYEVVSSDTVAGQKTLLLIQVQNYDTKLYWDHIDWYKVGYNSSIKPIAEVPVYSALDTLSLSTVPVGSSVRVSANAQGKFEIYLRTDLGWERVGLEDGTLQFKEELWNYSVGNFGFDVEVFDAQYFDQEPVIETRKVIQAINEELLVDELAIERNRALILMFNYVYSEFTAPEWLIKTSLIDVEHKIRALLPFQSYLQDNQTFVLDYIQEVKPYHVQIREFNLSYFGQDDYPGYISDFDVPAYYNITLPIPAYTSPVLTPYTASGSLIESFDSDAGPEAEIWTQEPWKAWFNNYLLELQSVSVVDGGLGYTVAPQVEIQGTCIEEPVLEAVVNSAGKVVAINIIDPGFGFSTNCVITLVGGNGVGARAVAVLGNNLVRSIGTTIKYDRCEYSRTIVDWEPNVNYDNGTIVRYLNRLWQADSDDSTGIEGPTFDITQWQKVDPGLVSLQYDSQGNYYEIVPGSTYISGANRTMGYYTPTVNEPGLSLPLLIDGIDYPGVQVKGVEFNQNTGFDVGNFDINPFDNISYGPEGRPTYDPAILDAIYESNYLDPYLGILPAPAYNGAPPNDTNAVVVAGGAYVDTYSSHAPEELVPGAEYDTLDLKVFTRPGSDWELNGHGFPEEVVSFSYTGSSDIFSFADVVPYPAVIVVFNQTTGQELYPVLNYSANWPNQTVSVINNASYGDVISIFVYELGGGNQLYKQTYQGQTVGNTLLVPVAFGEIQEFAIFVNGQYLSAELNDSTENYVYTAVGANQTRVTFLNTYTSSDLISLIVFGVTIVNNQPIDYSWSVPQTQIIVADGSMEYTLTNSLEYTNPDNLIVEVNGVRARSSAGAEYTADGSSAYMLPQRLGFSQSLISNNEVHVYLNDIQQVFGVDFTLETYDPVDIREVIFTTPPAIGTNILIYVDTNTQAYVNGNQLVFRPNSGLTPSLGDIISVTTWNDTRQQNILTKVFVGPVVRGITVGEPYDSVDFDLATVSNTPGSFDYSTGAVVTVNDLQLGRIITDPSRLWVTLNGVRQFSGVDFVLNGEEMILHSGVLQTTDVVMITMFTDSVVPEAMGFRIFQDMRGVQATYRITNASSTLLTQPLSADGDTIYVQDANNLGQPSLNSNIWGILIVNGERIMYRARNTTNNTISGLLRGTAGTAVAAHAVGARVDDLGRGNLLPEQYQNYIVSSTELADGTQTTFIAQDIDISSMDSTEIDEAVEVYVGGTRILAGYTVTGDSPVSIVFSIAPPNGVEVTILIRRGVTWYAPGAGTPSDGRPLQETNTQAARFLRGE
jgi:hypothetical protein